MVSFLATVSTIATSGDVVVRSEGGNVRIENRVSSSSSSDGQRIDDGNSIKTGDARASSSVRTSIYSGDGKVRTEASAETNGKKVEAVSDEGDTVIEERAGDESGEAKVHIETTAFFENIINKIMDLFF